VTQILADIWVIPLKNFIRDNFNFDRIFIKDYYEVTISTKSIKIWINKINIKFPLGKGN